MLIVRQRKWSTYWSNCLLIYLETRLTELLDCKMQTLKNYLIKSEAE